VDSIAYGGNWRIDVAAVTVTSRGEWRVEIFGDVTQGMEGGYMGCSLVAFSLEKGRRLHILSRLCFRL
jgi:hypothetical protein